MFSKYVINMHIYQSLLAATVKKKMHIRTGKPLSEPPLSLAGPEILNNIFFLKFLRRQIK